MTNIWFDQVIIIIASFFDTSFIKYKTKKSFIKKVKKIRWSSSEKNSQLNENSREI